MQAGCNAIFSENEITDSVPVALEVAQLADRVDELNDEILEVPRNPQGVTPEQIRIAIAGAVAPTPCKMPPSVAMLTL